MDPVTPKLRLQGVSKSFLAPRAKAPTLAVADFNLDIHPGEFVCIVGPSGCGKSTVLNMVAGLDTPDAGAIELDGRQVQGPGAERGVMFQDYALMPWQTVAQNVGFGLLHGTPGQGLSPAQRQARVAEHLELVGLTAAANKYPHQLSGGMRKRTSLAQTLALDPDIILMDEPFSALDIQTRQLMENEVLALWASKRKAVLFITHDLDEAIAMSDRVVVLSAGPAARPIGEFAIDLERPRDVAEVRTTPRFIELHKAIWAVLREEVLKGYAQQLQKV